MNLPSLREPRTGGLVSRNLAPVGRRLLGRKDPVVPPGGLFGGGWGPVGVASGSSQLVGDIRQYISTFGGDDAITYIFACVTTVMEEMALYPYDFVDPSTASDLSKCQPISYRNVPADLRELMKQPNAHMTYFEFMNWKEMDTELVGNSYWLKDQRNLLGQPNQILRLRPEFTRIAVDKQGIVVGYLYRVQGIDIPFDVDEVIHFKGLANPHSEYYGMGRVQGILREVGIELGVGKSIVGFFNNGTRLSGVLTISGVLPDDVFERMKQQFREDYSGAENAFSVLIAEQGMNFTPLTATPADSQVANLREISKDAIMAGFGLSEEVIGGAGGAGDVKMSEAQVLLTRKMRPRARRASEKITYDLTGLWGQIGLWIDTTEVVEIEVRIARSRDMLGAGATLNESRIEMGLPPYTPEFFPNMPADFYILANQPILPSGYEPFYIQQQASHGGGSPKPILPGGSNGNSNGNGEPTAPAGTPDRVRTDRGVLGIRLATGIRALGGKEILALPSGNMMALPDGYEDLGDVDLKQAAESDAERLLALQITTYAEEVPIWEQEMVIFFNDQRGRVLRSMGVFTDSHNAQRMSKKRQLLSKKEIAIGRVFDDALEHDELDSLYRARAQGVSQRTVNEIADIFGAAPADVRQIVNNLAARVVGINKTTKDRLQFQLAEGIARAYSVAQIANGVPGENYLGVQGVFDSATESRARTIARTETSVTYNLSALSGFNQIGVQRVEVLDGTYDQVCEEARGKVWSLAYAAENPIEHPNCVRSFIPIFTGTGR